jgi:hypothetical protein
MPGVVDDDDIAEGQADSLAMLTRYDDHKAVRLEGPNGEFLRQEGISRGMVNVFRLFDFLVKLDKSLFVADDPEVERLSSVMQEFIDEYVYEEERIPATMKLPAFESPEEYPKNEVRREEFVKGWLSAMLAPSSLSKAGTATDEPKPSPSGAEPAPEPTPAEPETDEDDDVGDPKASV